MGKQSKEGMLILLRHGQSEYNKQNRFTGWEDVPLSETGRKEAEKAGELLKSYAIDVVFCSELIRAIETAKIVMAGQKYPAVMPAKEFVIPAKAGIQDSTNSLDPRFHGDDNTVMNANNPNDSDLRQDDKLSLLQVLGSHAEIDEDQILIKIPYKNPCALLARLEQFFDSLGEKNIYTPPKKATQIHLPKNKSLPQSQSMLMRLHEKDFIPIEKKQLVVDLYRSQGPYMASVDEEPWIIFDAASQIATLGCGFQASIFLRLLHEKEEALVSLLSNHPDFSQNVEDEFKRLLIEQGWQCLQSVHWASGGAEANELAFDLCRLNGPGGKRIVAFEGAFHGRCIMALHATYNKSKRANFEFKGYEVDFVPFPIWRKPNEGQPYVEKDWILALSEGKIPHIKSANMLEQSELKSLQKLQEQLEKGDMCCVIVEPMQGEGGDNYATNRFFNGLRALTRYYKVPLIFDEVQTGFALSGNFYWHSNFDLHDANGNREGPDCITLAKKAQLGAVVSVWPEQRSSSPHCMQLYRGLAQAHAVLKNQPKAFSLEVEVLKQLKQLQLQRPDLVLSARAKGYAFGFDLPTPEIANQIVNSRFDYGFMVYIAGEQTIRFRLNAMVSQAELDGLFLALNALLRKFSDVEPKILFESGNVFPSPAGRERELLLAKAGEGGSAPDSTHTPTLSRPAGEFRWHDTFEVIQIDASNFSKFQDQIQALEEQIYEPGRRDSMETLLDWAKEPMAICLAVVQKGEKKLLGYCFGGPLELVDVDGPKQDPMRGRNNTFYGANLLLDKSLHGKGLGYELKRQQLELAKNLKNADGTWRYQYASGRNRVGFTSQITKINQSLGAYVLEIYDNQYGDKDGKALYYRIALRGPSLVIPVQTGIQGGGNSLDWAHSVQAPLGKYPQAIAKQIQAGLFTAPFATKLTLSNWATPNLVRYAELLRRILPAPLRHMYFTSSRDEMIDKGLRSFRMHKPNAQTVIGLKRQYLGHLTAATRSLTDDENQRQPFAWFDWPLVEHPSEVGDKRALTQIEMLIAQKKAEDILAIVVEPIGEKSAYVLSDEFLQALVAIGQKNAIPIVYVETASSLGRNGQSLFLYESLSSKPNMVLRYDGAQLGHIFVDDKYYVAKPLTLISTWDGDEISILRSYEHILEAQVQLQNKTAQRFEQKLQQEKWPFERCGQGLWHGFEMPNSKHAQKVIERAHKIGLRVTSGFNSQLLICPPIDIHTNEMDLGIQKLQEAMKL